MSAIKGDIMATGKVLPETTFILKNNLFTCQLIILRLFGILYEIHRAN